MITSRLFLYDIFESVCEMPEEALGAFVFGVFEYFHSRALFYDFAAVYEDNFIGYVEGEFEFVCDDY